MSRSETAKLWGERLQRFASSQMTVAQFCLSEGVSQASFYHWRKKLREASSRAKPKPSGVQFMPLRLTPESGDQVDPKPAEQAGPSLASAAIELPGGVRIRVEVPADQQPGQRLEART